jgi:carboxylate-amine ligase
MRTFGAEEELLLVDERTGEPMAAARQLLRLDEASDREAELTAELQQEMIEAVTGTHETIDGLAGDIAAGRASADRSARLVGARAVATATSPLAVQPHPTPTARYLRMIDQFGTTARNSLTCGLHVHVSIESADEGVAVLDRIRSWLPLLIAITANSPFSSGEDTGYQSYRSRAWAQWPSTGPTDVFGSVAAYRSFRSQLLATDVLLDEGMFYFDARLSRNHPTVEIRVSDVCLAQSTPVAVAAICRGLVETASREWKRDIAPAPVPSAVLRLASMRSALSGLGGDLLHPFSAAPLPAADALHLLLDHISDGLANGDEAFVQAELERLLSDGTAADWQRSRAAGADGIPGMLAEAADLTQRTGVGGRG